MSRHGRLRRLRRAQGAPAFGSQSATLPRGAAEPQPNRWELSAISGQRDRLKPVPRNRRAFRGLSVLVGHLELVHFPPSQEVRGSHRQPAPVPGADGSLSYAEYSAPAGAVGRGASPVHIPAAAVLKTVFRSGIFNHLQLQRGTDRAHVPDGVFITSGGPPRPMAVHLRSSAAQFPGSSCRSRRCHRCSRYRLCTG